MNAYPTGIIRDISQGSMSRREVLRRAAGLGLTVAVGGQLLAACGDGSQGSGGAANWDFLWYVPSAKNPQTEGLNEFVDAVKKGTGGDLELRPRPVGELPYDATDYVSAVGTGKVDMADDSSGFVTGSLKVGEIPTLPFLARTEEDMATVMNVLREPLDQELSKFGAKLLFWYSMPAAQIWGKGSPVKSLADLKGMKIRTYATMQNAFMESVDAVPASITTEEVAPSLQQNVIDATTTSALTVLPLGWYEFIDWGYLLSMQLSPNYVFVNSEVMSELSDKASTGLKGAATAANKNMLSKVLGAEQSYIDTLREKHGVETNEISDSEVDKSIAIMKPIWKKWADKQPGHVQDAFKEVVSALNV